MKFAHKSFYALALAATLFAGGCATSDSTEPVDGIEEENRLPEDGEEAAEIELPTAEDASAEASMEGTESIDGTSDSAVESLPTDQQLALENSALPDPNGAGGEIAPAADSPEIGSPMAEADMPVLPESPAPEMTVPGAETDMAVAAAPEMPAESPALPMAEPVMDNSIPTIADVVAGSESQHAAEPVAEKPSKKKKKGRRAAAAPVLNGDEKLYIVQPGDTLGGISTTLYGAPGRWRELADLNGVSSLIFPGDAIKYKPDASTAAFEGRFDSMAKASVTIEKGDTLSSIAQKVMGNASYWKMIWRWNEAAVPDPNRIAAGVALQYVSAEDLATVSGAAAAVPAH